MSTAKLTLFDTTLRDGTQTEGVTLTVDDKLRIAARLDALGIDYIEAGWPGANPKDDEFFVRAARGELKLKHAKLTAFSSTRRAGVTCSKDPNIKALVASQAQVACVFGKSWDMHVTHALRTTLAENLAMVRDTVKYLRKHFDEVIFDCEHFFDGFKNNRDYALAVANEAANAGARYVVLCDTNGGTLPDDVAEIVATVRSSLDVELGIHCHNDTDCGVANSLAALKAGAVHVQGTLNGLGERTGNARLASIIANLVLKLDTPVISKAQLASLSETCHFISELCNTTPQPQQPYVGTSAFAHKGGIHASAIARRRDLYEHVEPELVGNIRHLVMSELAGRATVELKAREFGMELGQDIDVAVVISKVKELEHAGYHFEAADGSFELLLRRAHGWEQKYFTIESFRTIVETTPQGLSSEATVKLHANGERIISTAEGNGPVNALDAALRRALAASFPEIEHIHLADYKVRILNEASGTAATTRVLIESSNGVREWGTVGVSENIIEASWEALVDGYVYGMLHAPPKRKRS